MVAILHNIRSLHNVGSIFRTSDGAGVEKIYLTGYTPAPVDKYGKKIPQLAKVSLGAEDFVKWEKTKDLNKVIQKLKKENYKIFAIEQDKKSVAYYKLPYFAKASKGKHVESDKALPKICLVVGNEVSGLSQSVLEKCDEILEIPMHGKKESLNVSVAYGVVVYRLANSY